MHHLERCNELKDSLYDHTTDELLSKYAALYDNEQLQLENQSERAAHRRSILIAAVMLALVVVAAWLLARQQHLEALMQQIETLMQQGQPDVNTLTPEENKANQFLAQVMEAVNNGLQTGRFDVDSVAAELNMSTSTFRRRIQETTGETPKAYISAIQMQKAANLLQDGTNRPIYEVARLCGYDETTNFSRTFKKYFGMTPTQYIKNKEENDK